MPFHNPAKYLGHTRVVKCGDADVVKVPQEPRRHRVASSPGGTHGPYHLNVNQMNGRRVLQVIPEIKIESFTISVKFYMKLDATRFRRNKPRSLPSPEFQHTGV